MGAPGRHRQPAGTPRHRRTRAGRRTTGRAAPARAALWAPLRHRPFRLLWIGMSTSLIGNGILLVALAWQVYDMSDLPSAMSAVGVALSLPQVVTLLVGGVVSDRFDPRRVMLLSDLTRGVVMASMAALTITGEIRLWHIFTLTAVYGAAAGFFGPAFDALVPQLVAEPDLVTANALDQFVRPAGMQIFGPMVGGAVIGLAGAGWAFAADAATFAVSAGCLLAMGRTASAPAPAAVPASASASELASVSQSESGPDEEQVSLWHELREGLSYVRRHVWLWGTFLSATFTYLLFVGPTEVLLPYVVKTELGGSATALGLVLTSGGLGAIAAALTVAWTGLPKQFITFMYGTWAVATLAVAGYGLATATWHLAVACVLVNGLEAAGTVAWATAKQRLVPGRLLGRVSSVDWFVSTALLPLSYAAAAPVAAMIGVRETLTAAGVLGSVVTLGFLFLPGMRAAQKPQEPAPAAQPAPASGPVPAADAQPAAEAQPAAPAHPAAEAQAAAEAEPAHPTGDASPWRHPAAAEAPGRDDVPVPV